MRDEEFDPVTKTTDGRTVWKRYDGGIPVVTGPRQTPEQSPAGDAEPAGDGERTRRLRFQKNLSVDIRSLSNPSRPSCRNSPNGWRSPLATEPLRNADPERIKGRIAINVLASGAPERAANRRWRRTVAEPNRLDMAGRKSRKQFLQRGHRLIMGGICFSRPFLMPELCLRGAKA